MRENYQDYFIEKPLCLIYWRLHSSVIPIKNYFSKDFEIRDIENAKDLEYWSKIAKIGIVVLGLNNLEKLEDFLKFLNNKLPIEKRRKIFLIYISPQAKTLDPKETFLKGVNLSIADEHLSDFENIYRRASQYWEILYKDFKTTLEKMKEEI